MKKNLIRNILLPNNPKVNSIRDILNLMRKRMNEIESIFVHFFICLYLEFDY